MFYSEVFFIYLYFLILFLIKAVSVLLCYIYQITFLFGWIAVYLNKTNSNTINNKNDIDQIHNKNKNDVAETKFLDISCDKIEVKSDHIENSKYYETIQEYMERSYKFLLTKLIGKIMISVIFIIYLSFSIWKIIYMDKSIDPTQTVSEKSYLKEYLIDFVSNDLSPPLMVIFHEPVDFQNRTVKKRVNKLFKQISTIDGISNTYQFLNHLIFELIQNSSISKENYKTLYEINPFYNDLSFTYNESLNSYQLVGTRFYFQLDKMHFNYKDTEIMENLYRLIKYKFDDLPVIVYSMVFRNIELFNQLPIDLLQLILISIEGSYLFSLCFVLNLQTALSIVFSISSVFTGFCGFMSTWNVPLNAITMINYAIGLAYSATSCTYIAHLYLIEFNQDSKEERIFTVIKQTGVSMIKAHLIIVTSSLILSFCNSLTFYILFKTILIVNFITIIHVLFFFPVLLSIIGPHWEVHRKCTKKTRMSL